MKRSLSFGICTCLSILLTSGFVGCSGPKEGEEVNDLIGSIRQRFAPDKRVALWDVSYEQGALVGETSLPEAFSALLDSLDVRQIAVNSQVNVLPDANLGDRTSALVTISVANIRSQPKHSAELATQALMGTPLKVLKQEGTWYLVQTPEGYISWVDAAGITLVNEAEMNTWNNAEKLIYTKMIGTVYAEKTQAAEPISDLTAGNLVVQLDDQGDYSLVRLPDGRQGFVKNEEMLPYVAWLNSRDLSDANLISTAKQMMGVPYLWGGTSPKGVDCSGFTKTIYFLNGMIIPRDASQQVNEGKEIDTTTGWENLEVGDLLFFGVPATDSTPERVVHVGMWIGNDSFIHSRGRVRISSFDPQDENYDQYELDRYLRTKRIRNQSTDHLWNVSSLIK